MKLFDSELKVMDVLWREGDLPAKAIAKAKMIQKCCFIEQTFRKFNNFRQQIQTKATKIRI